MKISPTRQEFHALAKENTVIPVWTEVLADVETPVSAYIKLVGDRPGFLLESVEHGERWSRFSFVGRDPVATLVLRDGAITTVGNVPSSMPATPANPIVRPSDTLRLMMYKTAGPGITSSAIDAIANEIREFISGIY